MRLTLQYFDYQSTIFVLFPNFFTSSTLFLSSFSSPSFTPLQFLFLSGFHSPGLVANPFAGNTSLNLLLGDGIIFLSAINLS
mgnify:CR=1 FL=1